MLIELRPSAQALRELPTLDTRTPERGVTEELRKAVGELGAADFCLELKLRTPTREYWLCTRGFAKSVPGHLEGFTVGYVTVDSKDEDGLCDSVTYGPNDVRTLHGLDYLRALRTELEALQTASEKTQKGRWERERRIEELRQEIDATEKAMRAAMRAQDNATRPNDTRIPARRPAAPGNTGAAK
jgi:hypothetical protein